MNISECRKGIEIFALDFYKFSNKMENYKLDIIHISNNIRIPTTELLSDYSITREKFLKHPANVVNKKKLIRILKESREEIEKFCEKYDSNY